MMAHMYILKCIDGSYYTGSTKNLEQRLWQHKTGKGANYTKIRLPIELVYSEYYERIDEAFAREKQIQKWSRKKKEALICGDMEKLRYLSKSNGRCLSKSHFDKLSDHTDELNDNRCLSQSHFDKLRDQTYELNNNRSLSLSKGKL